MKTRRKVFFSWVLGPTLLALSTYGCAALDHTHPDLSVDKGALDTAVQRAETAASKAESAASRAESAASKAETSASNAEGSARRAEAAAIKAERAADKAEAIFKKTLRK